MTLHLAPQPAGPALPSWKQAWLEAYPCDMPSCVPYPRVPLYTFLEETDLTTAYDRWNLIFGPWLFSAPYNDAWFTRSTMAGCAPGRTGRSSSVAVSTLGCAATTATSSLAPTA